MIYNHIQHADYIVDILPEVLSKMFTQDTLVLCDTRLLIKHDVLPHIPYVQYYDQRVLPILKNTTLILADGLDSRILSYFQSFGLCENIDIIDVPNNPECTLTEIILWDTDLIERIRARKFKKIVPLFVDSSVEKLAEVLGIQLILSKEEVTQANDKLALKKFLISEKLPTVEGVSTDNPSIISEYFSRAEHYFFKSPLWVSWYGFWSNKNNSLDQILSQYEGKEIIIERVIEKIWSPSIQFFIDSITWDGYIFAFTDQILENWQHYLWNSSPSTFLLTHPNIIDNIIEQSESIIGYMKSIWYRWFWWIDFMIDAHGHVYATEVNARFTGATYPAITSILLHNNVGISWQYMTHEGQLGTIPEYLQRSIQFQGEYWVFPLCIWPLESYGKVQILEMFPKLVDEL